MSSSILQMTVGELLAQIEEHPARAVVYDHLNQIAFQTFYTRPMGACRADTVLTNVNEALEYAHYIATMKVSMNHMDGTGLVTQSYEFRDGSRAIFVLNRDKVVLESRHDLYACSWRNAVRALIPRFGRALRRPHYYVLVRDKTTGHFVVSINEQPFLAL